MLGETLWLVVKSQVFAIYVETRHRLVSTISDLWNLILVN